MLFQNIDILKNLDLFGRGFNLALRGKEKVGTWVGFTASLLFATIMASQLVVNVIKLRNHAVVTASTQKVYHDLEALPTVAGSDMRFGLIVAASD